MRLLIDVKYGGLKKAVQLPVHFSSSGFEDCLQSVFPIKGKSVFGLRFPNESDILVLDEITDEKQLIKASASRNAPLCIVFHSRILCDRLKA